MDEEVLKNVMELFTKVCKNDVNPIKSYKQYLDELTNEDITNIIIFFSTMIKNEKDLEKINNYNGKCYLAIENNSVVGLIMGCIHPYDEYDYLDYKCPKAGEVTELIVSQDARSKGIGQLLLNSIEKYFKKVGCEYVLIDVFAYNERMYTDIKKL